MKKAPFFTSIVFSRFVSIFCFKKGRRIDREKLFHLPLSQCFSILCFFLSCRRRLQLKFHYAEKWDFLRSRRSVLVSVSCSSPLRCVFPVRWLCSWSSSMSNILLWLVSHDSSNDSRSSRSRNNKQLKTMPTTITTTTTTTTVEQNHDVDHVEADASSVDWW